MQKPPSPLAATTIRADGALPQNQAGDDAQRVAHRARRAQAGLADEIERQRHQQRLQKDRRGHAGAGFVDAGQQNRRNQLGVKPENGDVRPRQKQVDQHADEPHDAQKRAVLPAHGGVVRRVELVPEGRWRAQRQRRAVRQHDNLPLRQKRRGSVRPLGGDALRNQRHGVILDDLFDFARRQREIALAGRQTAADAREHGFVRRAAQIQQRASGFHRAADAEEFRHQLLALHDAPKQRDVRADGFAETLVRPEDDLLRLRPADGALFKPARVHYAGTRAAVAEQHTLAGERVGNQLVKARFGFRRQDGDGVFHQIADARLGRNVRPRVVRQRHARLEDVFVDFARIGHAVDGHQRGKKRAGAETADDDVRVIRRAEAVAKNPDVAG